MRVIAISNQKGGTGKTTSAINIAYALSSKGNNILLIDLDPQASLTSSLGINPENTIYQLLKREIPLEESVINRNNVAVIPADLNLAAADIELSGVAGREFLLQESLDDTSAYDFVLLDCPPSLGLLTLNALTAAREVFIPVQTEFLALQGMSKLLETIEIVKKRLNRQLILNGIIATRYDKRRVLNREVIENLHTYFGTKLFNTFIRENIALAEAPSFGQDIFSYRPNSTGAADYLMLSQEIIERGFSNENR